MYTILFFRVFYEKAATMVIPDNYEDFTPHEESDKDTEMEPAQHLRLYVQAEGTQVQNEPKVITKNITDSSD